MSATNETVIKVGDKVAKGAKAYEVLRVSGDEVELQSVLTGVKFESSVFKLWENGYRVVAGEPVNCEPNLPEAVQASIFVETENKSAASDHIAAAAHDGSVAAETLTDQSDQSTTQSGAGTDVTDDCAHRIAKWLAAGNVDALLNLDGFETIPDLPNGLKYLFANSVKQLPELPASLKCLYANSATSLPELPASLKCLYADSATALPELPASLEYLSANSVKQLPAIHGGLKVLCANNATNKPCAAATNKVASAAPSQTAGTETAVGTSRRVRTPEEIMNDLRRKQSEEAAKIDLRYRKKLFKAGQRLKSLPQKRAEALDLLQRLREKVRNGFNDPFMLDDEADARICHIMDDAMSEWASVLFQNETESAFKSTDQTARGACGGGCSSCEDCASLSV